MFQKSLLLISLLTATSSFASWTCSGVCGMMVPEGLMSASPLTVVFGSGLYQSNAYEDALKKCTAIIPKEARPFLVKRVSITTAPKFSDKSELMDPALPNESCIKD